MLSRQIGELLNGIELAVKIKIQPNRQRQNVLKLTDSF